MIKKPWIKLTRCISDVTLNERFEDSTPDFAA